MLHIDGKPMFQANTTPHSNDSTSDDTTTSTSAESQQAIVNITSAPVQSTTSPQLKFEVNKLPPTLQMTTQVYVELHDGGRLKAHALLDSAASISLITDHLVQQLHLRKHHLPISISGVQDMVTGVSQHTMSFIVVAVNATQDNIHVSASVVPKVSADLPLQFINFLAYGNRHGAHLSFKTD